MKKSILKLSGAQELSKGEQKSIEGAIRELIRCYHSSDPICCGTAQWQCGVGPHSGGLYRPHSGTCVCF